MRNHPSLNLIYRILDGGDEESYVEVLRFFSEAGPVIKDRIDEAYQKYRFHSGPNYYFKTLEEMGQFALDICQDSGAPEVFVLSDADYNLGLDSCGDVKGFREIFRRYGNIIENPDQTRKKNNIFNKLFN